VRQVHEFAKVAERAVVLFSPSSFVKTNQITKRNSLTNHLEDGSFGLVKPVPDSVFRLQ